MKTLTLIVLALALSYATPRAQGRGHAYGRYKHEEHFEHARPGPAVRVYTYSQPRVYYYTPPRVYYYRRPSITFSFPFGYSTYQPYRSYYYPYGSITTRRYALRREHEREGNEQHFAHERRER